MDEQQEIVQTFIEEAADLIERIRSRLDGYERAGDQEERLTDLLRAVHTIKGGAATCGFAGLKERAHRLEAEIQPLRATPGALDEAYCERVRRAVDGFESELSGEVVRDPPADAGFGIFDGSSAGTPLPPAPVAAPQAAAPTPGATEMLRIPVERVQRNLDVVSEVFLVRNQLAYLVEQFRQGAIGRDEFYARWEALDSTLRGNVGELERTALAMRMMPIKSVLRRMEKTIRSYVAENAAKDIRVEIHGEDTELDKKIIDSLAEPLIHLTRNAMDHGIGPAEERQRQGKPRQATIGFDVAVVGNEVLITVADDGRGIDAEKVLASAKRKGLDVSAACTQEEIISLIFAPGFSTAERVSEVSGRGIGLDAVKTYVEGLGGTVTIKTELGVGTQFILRLPLGMSVVPVIIAQVAGQKIALSTSDLLETRKASERDVVRNGDEVFYKRDGVFIPCFDLEDYLQRPVTPGMQRFAVRPRDVFLCVLEHGGRLIAVRVGEFVGNADLAVKPLPDACPPLSYVAGVAILATGEPAFVLSLARLYDRLIRPKLQQRDREVRHGAA